MNPVKKFGVAYLRVSDPKQVENFSLDNQAEAILQKAKQESYTIVKTFREEGKSGKNLDRPELQELIKFVSQKANNIQSVFIYKYDRLNRNSLEFQILRQLFAKLGVSIISATEISGETPEVAFVQNLLSAFSEFENSVKSERVKQGLKKRFQEGYTSTYPHHGYKREIQSDGKTLEVPCEPQFAFLQDSWKKIAYEGWSLVQVRAHINSSGIFPKLAKQTISQIFTETFYFGQLQSKKYGSAQGKHQAMVGEETFYLARAAIQGRTKHNVKISKLREELPLRGFLACPKCLKRLTGGESKGRSNKYFYYNCQRRDHGYFGLPAERINQEFLELLKRIKPKPNAIQFFEELMTETYGEKFKDYQISSKQVGQDIETAEKALKNLKIKHLNGLYDDEEFAEMKEELKIQILVKTGLLHEKTQDKTQLQKVLAFMRFYLKNLDGVFLKAEPETRLLMLGSIFPSGLTHDKKEFIEPQLGYCYRLNEFFSEVRPTKYPCVVDYRTMFASYQQTYIRLSPYFNYV